MSTSQVSAKSVADAPSHSDTPSTRVRRGGCPHREGCPHWKNGVLTLSGTGKPLNRGGSHSRTHGDNSHSKPVVTAGKAQTDSASQGIVTGHGGHGRGGRGGRGRSSDTDVNREKGVERTHAHSGRKADRAGRGGKGGCPHKVGCPHNTTSAPASATKREPKPDGTSSRGGGCPHKLNCPHWRNGVLAVSGTGKPKDRGGPHAGGHAGTSHARQ